MHDFFPGLAGVPAAKSTISFVDGQKGILEYRGIPVEELANKSSFAETSFLLLYDRLPTKPELHQFELDLRQHRRIKYRIIDLIKCLPEQGHPMDALQAAVAALGMFYPINNVRDQAMWHLAAVRLIAKLPTIVASFGRSRRGDDPLPPRDDLSLAENFLYMLTEKVPDPQHAKILDVCLILHAEHTMNASTFSGMVTASTLADPFTVISSSIGTLNGPLHGGANEAVIHMLREVGSVQQVKTYVEDQLTSKEKIMGFGHRVYKVKDPRAIVLQEFARELVKESEEDSLFQIARAIEQEMEQRVGHKGIRPNVDFYSGIIYHHLGIDTDLFTPIFAMARVSGWLAHCFEQYQANHLFRPGQIYEGLHHRSYVPLESR
jgi:citrate synthase